MIRDRLIFSEAFAAAIAADPVVVVDVGARGSVEEPWASLPDPSLRVIGFEPDEDECRRLNAESGPSQTYIPAALWSKPGEVEVHVAEFPGCSSVHPPNMELLRDRYPDAHWQPRTTRDVARFRATTLDRALHEAASPACDFIKIDTQGSEHEVLSGATSTLEETAFGALVETWTTEVHHGQHLTGEVLTLMAGHGFELFDINIAAAWHRRAGQNLDLGGKRQITGLDLLFFRDPLRWPSPQPSTKLLKAAGIADVYGFPDFAIEILDSEGARAENPEAAGRMRAHVLAGSGKGEEEYASLHY